MRQCGKCGPRSNIEELDADIPPYSFSSHCDDTANGGMAGYGTDTHDCGKKRVQFDKGVVVDGTVNYKSRRKMQQLELIFRPRPPPSYKSPSPPPPHPPPSPLSSPPPTPPPPPPSPPAGLDRCECSCYADDSSINPAISDMDWDPMALSAMATIPSENTVLYSAYSIAGRGATVQVDGIAHVNGDSNSINRYVHMPALSSRVAHIASGWRVSSSDAVARKVASNDLSIITQPPSYFLNLCPAITWWAGAYTWTGGYNNEPRNAHMCSRASIVVNCVFYGSTSTATPQDSNCGTPQDCFALYTYGTDGPCDECYDCQVTGGKNVLADAWNDFPNASTAADDWRDRCASYCVRTVPRPHQLAYFQVDLQNLAAATCSCYETTSPRLPSDADATEWITQHATHVPAESVNLYLIRANHPKQRYVDVVGGTVNYEQAFSHGVIAVGAGVAWEGSSTAPSSVDECIDHCALFLGTSLQSFGYSTGQACYCSRQHP